MAYTPPSYNAVDFDESLYSPYTPPANSAVDFNFEALLAAIVHIMFLID
jgi:hypothetical protein